MIVAILRSTVEPASDAHTSSKFWATLISIWFRGPIWSRRHDDTVEDVDLHSCATRRVRKCQAKRADIFVRIVANNDCGIHGEASFIQIVAVGADAVLSDFAVGRKSNSKTVLGERDAMN